MMTKIRYAGRELEHVTEHDAAELTEFFANIFGAEGLDGEALDLAIADCLRPAFESIERHRAAIKRRTDRVRLVKA